MNHDLRVVVFSFLILFSVKIGAVDAPPKDAEKLESSKFFQDLIDKIPQAEAGAFEKPQAVVQHFFDALLKNDIPSTFKCFPFKLRFEKNTFEREVRFVELYSIKIPAPDDAYERFFRLFDHHRKVVHFYRTLLLAQLDKDTEKLITETTDAPKIGTSIDALWLEKVASKISLKRLSVYAFEVVSVKAGLKESIEIDGLKISDFYLIEGVAKYKEKRVPIDCYVGKVNGNYQILQFPDLPE